MTSLESAYIITGIGILGFLLLLSLFSRHKSRHAKDEWSKDWWNGFSTEMAGAIITALLIGLIFKSLQDIEDNQRQQDQLILQMGSPSKDIAADAVRLLRELHLLDPDDTTLENQYFKNTNLSDMDLSNIKLRGTIFDNTKLENVKFIGSDLTDVHIDNVNLKGVNFTDADLSNLDFKNAENFKNAIWKGANLTGVHFNQINLNTIDFSGTTLDGIDFSGVNLSHSVFNGATLKGVIFEDTILIETDFRGADMSEAIFRGANLENAIFDENTILPDGTHYKNGISLSIFTT